MQVLRVGVNIALAAVIGKGDEGKGGGKIDNVEQQSAPKVLEALSDGKVDGKGGLLDIIA